PRAVDDVEERHPALAAAGSQAARDAIPRAGLLAGAQVFVLRLDLSGGHDPGEVVRERLDSTGAQRLELCSSRDEQLVVLSPGLVGRAHVPIPAASSASALSEYISMRAYWPSRKVHSCAKSISTGRPARE